MASIPADLIGDILSRLPVKDLLRFRCVLEFFKPLIDSPDFIKLHLLYSIKTRTNLYGIFEIFKFNHKLYDLSRSTDNVVVEMVKRPPGFHWAREWDVVGSCNGLVALECRDCISLWNPMTGKAKKLTSNVPDYTQVHYGFGYDPITDDYKLVRIRSYSGSDSNSKRGATIYSLKTNSWKEICNEWSFDGRNFVWQKTFCVLANNAFHWLIGRGGVVVSLVAFDFVKEEFYVVPVLECFKTDLDMELGVLDGCLTLSTRYENNSYVWVMKEYLVKESWTILLHFESGHCLTDYSGIMPLTYSRDGNKLLLNCRCIYSDLFWYDLSTKEVEPLYVNEVFQKGFMKTFIGSLVALSDDTDEVDLNEKSSSSGVTKKRRRTRGDTSKGGN